MIERTIKEKFKSIPDTRKVILLTGARQVGNSTFKVKEFNPSNIKNTNVEQERSLIIVV